MTSIAPDGTIYDLTGPKDAPVVALIHGLGLSRSCWQWSKPALSDRYRILTYDLFGHGQSPVPPTIPSLSMFAAQFRELMTHLGIPAAALVGFSLGGMIARRLAQDLPEQITALAILSSPHQRSAAAQAALLQRIEQARSDGPAGTVEAAMTRWFTEGYRADHPAMMDLVRYWIMSNNRQSYHSIYRVLAEGIDEITGPDPAIACPTLVMTGAEDVTNSPAMAHAIAAEINGAEIHILKGLRHMALAEDPAAVNIPLRRFLDRTIGASA